MSKNSKKSYLWKHCFRRKDWTYNRKRSGASVCKLDLDIAVCSKCNNRCICLPKSWRITMGTIIPTIPPVIDPYAYYCISSDAYYQSGSSCTGNYFSVKCCHEGSVLLEYYNHICMSEPGGWICTPGCSNSVTYFDGPYATQSDCLEICH